MSLCWAPVDSGPRCYTSPTLTTYRPCPVCGSLRAKSFSELSDYQFYTDDPDLPKRTTIRNVQCESCFAAFLNPVYTDVGYQILFAQAERSYGAKATHVEEQLSWMVDRELLGEGAAVLDVGCYDGSLLEIMPAGVRRIGVDIDAAAIERARGRLGNEAELVHGDFERFEISTAPDLILMLHVLEHLPRPVSALAALRKVAHESTRLVIEVPVLEGRPTNDLVGFFTIQHTTHFSRRSLANCLARAGWRTVESWPHPDYNGNRVMCVPATPDHSSIGDPEDTTLVREALIRWHRATIAVTRATAPLAETDRCIIWGGGVHLEHLYAMTPFFRARRGREYVILDSDEAKQGHTWRGIDIHHPDALTDPGAAGVPILASSYGSQLEIARAAVEYGVEPNLVCTLYDEVNAY
jgi:SAM-dependent methyltransferase